MMTQLMAIAGLLMAASTQALATSPIVIEGFDLYTDRNHKPNNFCDTLVNMQIDHMKKTVTLRNEVRGMCEVYAEPNERTYRIVRQTKRPEGYLIRAIRTEIQDAPAEVLTIMDHRRAQIRRYYPNLLVVREKSADRRETELFSARPEYQIVPETRLSTETLRCDGMVEGNYVTLSNETGRRDELSLTTHRPAGPMLPAFVPAHETRFEVTQAVRAIHEDLVVVEGVANNLLFAGGGSQKFRLEVRASNDSEAKNSKLVLTTEAWSQPEHVETIDLRCSL